MRATEGQYSRNLVPVTTHATGVIPQLKEIDDAYFVMLNKRTQKFEIHSSKNKGIHTVCLVFDELDGRVIEEIRRTRIENIKKLIKQMDEDNFKLEMEQSRKFRDESDFHAGEIYDWMQHHSDPHIPANANTTRHV